MAEISDQQVWYIIGGACLFLVAMVVYLTRRIPWWWLKSLIRALAGALCLVPAAVPGQSGAYAPAFVIAFFETVFQPNGNPDPAIRQLVSISVAVLALVLLAAIVRWFLRRSASQQTPSHDLPETSEA